MEIVAELGTEHDIHAKYHELNSPHGLWESYLLRLTSEKSVCFSTKLRQWTHSQQETETIPAVPCPVQ